VSATELVGKKLGDYVLERQFASGGMAHIYLGRDERLGRLAAVKVLTPEILAQDNTLAERFEREARAVAQLEHDNIIPIYQFDQQDDLYFLAMRYVDGSDLAQLLNGYRQQGELMPVDRALYILAQVASALDHAHEHGIIHRDVKPSNVLIGAYDKAFLSDFGLVLWQGVDRTMGTAFGTPRYISPEQATDSEQSVSQSDVYSLAVMVYEILTGEVLFKGNTPMEVALAHITETPIPPRTHNSSIPADAQQEILKALSKEPDKRHNRAFDFISAVQQAYERAGTSTQSLADLRPKQSKDTSNNIDHVPPTRLFPLDERPDLDDDSAVQTPLKQPSPRPRLADDTQSRTMLESEEDSKPVIRKPNPSEPSQSSRASRTSTQPSIATRPSNSNNGALLVAVLAVMVAVVAVLIVLVRDNNTGATNNDGDTPTLAASVLTEQALTSVAASALVTDEPTEVPSNEPTDVPTDEPTDVPTDAPTNVPTDTPTDAPTNTPTVTPTATPPVVAMGELRGLRFLYNTSIFALRNDNEVPISLGNLSFTANRNVTGDDFSSTTQNLGTTLQPLGCVVILSGSARVSDIPDAWGCNAERGVTLGSPTVFWFADAPDDEQFRVENNGNTIVTCDTVGRAVGRLNDLTCP
jgi:serine/threonine protein kinase